MLLVKWKIQLLKILLSGTREQVLIKYIYIYDNNEVDGERFEEVLQEYIDNNFVEIINKRGDHENNRHANGLTEHYMKYNGEYDWLIYLDLGELLYIKDNKTLRECLSEEEFKSCQLIKIFWEIHGDNEYLRYGKGWMWEKFPKSSNFNHLNIQ